MPGQEYKSFFVFSFIKASTVFLQVVGILTTDSVETMAPQERVFDAFGTDDGDSHVSDLGNEAYDDAGDGTKVSMDSSNQNSSSGGSTGNSSYELFGLSRANVGAIGWSRILFLGTLLVAAIGLSLSVFFVLKAEEEDDFRAQVRDVSCGTCELPSSLSLMEHVLTFASLV